VSDAYDEYLKLTAKLLAVRKEHEGKLSQEEFDAIEDPILDDMDPLWWDMTHEERDKIDAEAAERLAALDGDS